MIGRLAAALALGLLPAALAAQEAPPDAPPETLAEPLPETAPAPRPRPGAPAEAPSTVAEPEAAAAPARPAAPLRGVLLRALDKFSGVATTLGVEPGRSARYERLVIGVRRCVRGAQGDMAWLVITDAKTPEAPVFEGWMFAESPALSALDHPRYDVWLASCNTRSGGAD